MKNKKGFTIVELLITIAVVASILAIAILAFSKLNDKQKLASWDEVKNEMKLAATQYLDVNEYLINDIKKDENVYITLETLINSDYLTILTNPVTGEQLDKCDVVKVNKQKEYTYLTKSEAIEEIGEEYFSNGCSIEPTVVSESERPKLMVSIYKAANADCAIGEEYKKYTFTTSRSETTNWFNKENSPYGIVVKLSLSNGSKFNVTYNDGKLNYSNYPVSFLNICTSQDQNMNDLNIKFGNNVTASVKINLDLNAPVIKVNANKSNVLEQAKNYTATEKYYNNSWYNGYVWVGATAIDSNSNVKKLIYTRTPDSTLGGSKAQNIQIDNNSKIATINDYSANEGISNYSYKACDEAGNCSSTFEYCNQNNSCSTVDKFTVMLDHTAPIVSMHGYITNVDNDIIDTLTQDAENQGVSKGTLFNSYISSNKLKEINSDTWTNKAIAVKPTYSDKLSGVSTNNSVCVDPRTDKTKYPDFTSYRRVMNTWEGDYKFNCTITDNAGNKTTKAYVVKRDVTKPTCTLTTNGTKGNKVDGLQWYIKDDVSLALSCTDAISGVNSYGLAASEYKYNGLSTGTQSSEIKKVTWGGIAKDNAGNEVKVNSPFGLEKTVSFAFNPTLSGKAKSDSSATTAKGKLVFNTNAKSDLCSYGNCKNINCRTDKAKTKVCPTNYFARACWNVDTYPRFFDVKAKSFNNGNKITIFAMDASEETAKIDGVTYHRNSNLIRSQEIFKYGAIDNADKNMQSPYYYNEVGEDKHPGWRNDYSAHKYQFTTPAGNKSSEIRLYIEYIGDCEYSYK